MQWVGRFRVPVGVESVPKESDSLLCGWGVGVPELPVGVYVLRVLFTSPLIPSHRTKDDGPSKESRTRSPTGAPVTTQSTDRAVPWGAPVPPESS